MKLITSQICLSKNLQCHLKAGHRFHISFPFFCTATLHFFSTHHTYFCVRPTDGAARIYFFLSLSLPERVTLWLRIIPVHIGDRGKKREEEKKPRKKPLHHDWDLNPRTLSPEQSVLSIRPRHPAQSNITWSFTITSILRHHGHSMTHSLVPLK